MDTLIKINTFKVQPIANVPIMAYHEVMGWVKTYGNKDLGLFYTHWFYLPEMK